MHHLFRVLLVIVFLVFPTVIDSAKKTRPSCKEKQRKSVYDAAVNDLRLFFTPIEDNAYVKYVPRLIKT
jgi:hypothetical protein